MNTNTNALRVFTLADGRRIKEVREVDACRGCMFSDLSAGCNAPWDAELEACRFSNIIYQPAGPEPVAVAEPVKREPLTDEQVASAFKGWGINHAQESQENSGAWELGHLDEEDIFSPLITVDAGLYHQPQHSEPMARALLAAIKQPHHAQQAQREPLTDEQISELMMNVWGCASIGARHVPAFARAIERAHGIGWQDKGAGHDR